MSLLRDLKLNMQLLNFLLLHILIDMGYILKYNLLSFKFYKFYNLLIHVL